MEELLLQAQLFVAAFSFKMVINVSSSRNSFLSTNKAKNDSIYLHLN